MSILFADDIHFHAHGFPGLFHYLRSRDIAHDFHAFGNKGLKKAAGAYSPGHQVLAPIVARLRALPVARWQDLEVAGIPLYDTARYEILSHVMARPHWYGEATPNDGAAVFEKLARRDYDTLLVNMAAAWFWVEYWEKFFASSRTDWRYFCVFGNSQIYARAGTQCAARRGIVPCAFEHLFTGHHHFIEPRLGAIQGFSALRLPVPAHFPADPLAAGRALAAMRNRNVRAPAPRAEAFFANGRKTILLLAQVANDLSLVTDGNRVLGSVALYKELIAEILARTPHNIIVKTHPYEAAKLEGCAVTHDALTQFAAALDGGSRIRIVDDYPLDTLFLQSDAAVTISSQAGLEALHHHVPVSVLSDAFYAGHGFTHDFTSPAAFAAAAAEGTVFRLEEGAVAAYDRFMTRALSVLVGPDTQAEVFHVFFRAAAARAEIPAGPEGQAVPAGAPSFTGLRNARAYRKLRKLVKSPSLYFADARRNRRKRRDAA